MDRRKAPRELGHGDHLLTGTSRHDAARMALTVHVRCRRCGWAASADAGSGLSQREPVLRGLVERMFSSVLSQFRRDVPASCAEAADLMSVQRIMDG